MSHKGGHGKIETTLARARGHGSAHHGVESWIRLRVTAVGNAVLGLWFIWFVKKSVGLDHAGFTELLAQPCNAVAMILLIVSVFYHATLGCREIVEDYVHAECLKITKLLGMYLFFFAAAVACIFSVLKIAL